ncbi:MAG TPA: hypothetical protein VMW24_22465 [Sedimentisphaerales bacterium]|nr:hypothetical protein [Sedimentisphaerales bacterium]
MQDTDYGQRRSPASSIRALTVRVRRGMESRYAPAIIAGIAAFIMLPALNAGFIQDDLYHRVRLVQPSELPERLYDTGMISSDAGTLRAALRDMHSFARTKQQADTLKECGMCPWWTTEDWRLANWRPLDSFTHWLDYRLFPDYPPLMHLHNILWFAAVIFLLASLYRQLMTPLWLASFAALLYTIDESNYFPAMWIANRNLILALFFCLLTLLLHHKWRRDDSVAAGVGAVFALLLSLLSTEAGVATFAYLLAYALILDRGSWTRRLVSLAPGVIVIAAWRLIYNGLGYGASGSGFVIDPGREPLRYAWAVIERAPALLCGQWGPTAAEMTYFFCDYAAGWYALAGGAFLIVLLLVLIPLLRRNRTARFWFVGMLLCVLPICATMPMNRNLLFVAIGAFGLTAQFIAGMFARESWLPASRFWRVPAWILCVTLIITHIGVAAAARARAPKIMSLAFKTFYSTINVDPSIDLKDRTLVVVNAPNPFLFMGLPFLRAYETEPMPRSVRLLAPGFEPLEITRTGEKTLLVAAQKGNLLSTNTSRRDFKLNFVYFYSRFDCLFRPEKLPFQASQKIDLNNVSVEVTDIDTNGQPTQVLFHFAAPLDDPALCWLQWTWERNGLGSYSTFEVPPVGEKRHLAGPFGDE